MYLHTMTTLADDMVVPLSDEEEISNRFGGPQPRDLLEDASGV